MEGRGTSGVFWQIHIFYNGHSQYVNWRSIDSCQNGIATDQHHMTKLWAHVLTHRVLVARVFLAGNCVDD